MRLRQANKFIYLFLFIVSLSLASAILLDNPNLPLVKNTPTVISFNNATASVNNSQYFNGYSIASLWTLYETYVLGLGKWDDYLLLAGGIMTGDINMSNNDIINGGGGSYFNRTLTIDGDIGDENADATLVITSGNNLHACINLTEGGGALGFQICNDGSGDNRLVFSNAHDGYEWFWIDRDDGTINFLNDTIFTNLVVENVNSTGNITAPWFNGNWNGSLWERTGTVLSPKTAGDVDLGANKLILDDGAGQNKIYADAFILSLDAASILSIDFDGVPKYEWQPTVISPTASMNGLINLGGTSHQFKDLYLAGKIDLGTNTITDGSMTGNWDFGSGTLTTTGTNTAGYQIINQTADNVGLQINGYDNVDNENGRIFIDQNGHTIIAATDQIRMNAADAFSNYQATFTSNGLLFRDDKFLQFGLSTEQSFMLQSTAQTVPAFILGVDKVQRTFLICDRDDRTFDFEHALPDNPSVFIHSANQATDEWLGLTYNGITQGIDNFKYYAGAGKDASITYDGTDMIINPKEVGGGKVIIDGDLTAGVGTFGVASNQAVIGHDDYAGYFTDGTRTAELADGSYAGEFYDGLRYAYLGDGTNAVYGLYSSYSYGKLGSSSYGVEGYKDASGTAAGYFSDGTRTVSLSDGTYALYAAGEGRFVNGGKTTQLSNGNEAINTFDGAYSSQLSSGTYAGYFYDLGSIRVYLSDGTYAVNAAGNSLFTGAVTITGNINIDSDINKLFLGDGQDVSTYFDSANWIFNAEVGTPNVNWTGFSSYNFDNDVKIVGDLNVTGGVTAGASTFGDGGTTNYANFAADGELTLAGTARVYKNEWLDVGSIRVPSGGSPATITDWGISIGYEFTDGASDQVIATVRIPQDMDRSVAPEFKIGFASATNTGDVDWQVEYLWRTANEDTTAAAQETLTTTTDISGGANGLTIATLTGMDLPSDIDQLIMLRITRIGSTDTIGDDVTLVGAGIKYVSNKLGDAT